MAINRNNALKARHVCYCGTTGGGKAVAVKSLGLVGDCVALFDVYGDYLVGGKKTLSGLGNGRQVQHYTARRTFFNAFVEAWASGKKFAVAYMPNKTGDALEIEAQWFGQLVWEASDGNRELHVVWEEMATYCKTSGKDNTIIGQCATGGRKFGMVNHFVFQKPTEVSKTYTSNSPTKVIGAQEDVPDAEFWMKALRCTMDEVVELGKLNEQFELAGKHRKHYLIKKQGIGNYSKMHIDF